MSKILENIVRNWSPYIVEEHIANKYMSLKLTQYPIIPTILRKDIQTNYQNVMVL